jgi:hypothetical protein
LTKLTKKDWLGDFDIQRQVHFWYSTVLMFACHYQGRDDLTDFAPYAFLKKEDLCFAENNGRKSINKSAKI